MYKRINKLFCLVCMILIMFTNINAYVQENTLLSLSFDYNDKVEHSVSKVLEDGTEITLIATPVDINDKNALNGVWRITGSNNLQHMY